MADTRGIASIDDQLARFWATYRKWVRGEQINMNPLMAFETVDVLLEQRHDLTTSQGEMLDQRDVASIAEYGPTGFET